jgi:hypothetical protein
MAEASETAGHRCLHVGLTPEVRAGEFGVDFVDQPTFVILPDKIRNGTVEVDLLATLAPHAPDYARGFIGIAYRIRVDSATNDFCYESVYLRPLNGRRLDPPAPRHQRAVQYYCYPDWKFDRFRDEEPDGGWEGPADITPDTWTHVRLDLNERRVEARVNDDVVLSIERAKVSPALGQVGLWVDIGTDGYFANLQITRAEDQ